MNKKLKELFIDEYSMHEFMGGYFSMYKTPTLSEEDIDCFGWDAVADEINSVLGQGMYDVCNWVMVEIGSMHTLSGNPELITVGYLVEMPVPDPEQENDPDYNDETGFIGDYVGNYKLSNNEYTI